MLQPIINFYRPALYCWIMQKLLTRGWSDATLPTNIWFEALTRSPYWSRRTIFMQSWYCVCVLRLRREGCRR
jgi:hypothetical protein